MRFVRTSAAVISVALAAVALTACSGSSGDTSSSSGSPSTSGTLFSELPKSIQKAGVLNAAGDPHPPFRTVGSDGKITGIDPDLWAALSKELGVKVVIQQASAMPAILTGMQAGRWDAYNGPVQDNAEREADFDAITWLKTSTSYVFPIAKKSTITDGGGICGLKVAIVAGSIVAGDLKALNTWCTSQGKKPATEIDLVDTNATVLAVQSGRADALGLTETGAIGVLQSAPKTFAYVDQTSDEGAGVSLLAMLAPKDSGLGKVLLKAFQRIFADGEYAKVLKKWGLTAVAVDKPLINSISNRTPA